MSWYWYVFWIIIGISAYSEAKRVFRPNKKKKQEVANLFLSSKGHNGKVSNYSTQEDSGGLIQNRTDQENKLSKNTEAALYFWLKQTYGDDPYVKIYKSIYFPNPIPNETTMVNIDVAMLGRNGLIVFEVKAAGNTLHSVIFFKNKYVLIYKNKNNDYHKAYFEHNPFSQNENHLKKLDAILQKDCNLNKIHRKGIVVNYLLAGHSEVNICINEQEISEDNDYVYLFSKDNKERIQPYEKGYRILESKIDSFMSTQPKLDSEVYKQVALFLYKYSDAPREIKKKHKQEVNRLKLTSRSKKEIL